MPMYFVLKYNDYDEAPQEVQDGALFFATNVVYIAELAAKGASIEYAYEHEAQAPSPDRSQAQEPQTGQEGL